MLSVQDPVQQSALLVLKGRVLGIHFITVHKISGKLVDLHLLTSSQFIVHRPDIVLFGLGSRSDWSGRQCLHSGSQGSALAQSGNDRSPVRSGTVMTSNSWVPDCSGRSGWGSASRV